MDNGAVTIKDLEALFSDCDYIFRHYPNGKVPAMTWQAGRLRCIEVAYNGECWLDEAFELLAWASTSEQLIDKLSALD